MDDVLDPAVVADLRRAQEAFANPEFIRQLVDLFRASAPVKLDLVRQALAAGDALPVRDAAHALRSSCGMLGASRMAGACGEMEEAASRADLTAAAAALREADEQLPAVLEALALLCSRGT
jgi:HPt (histidine-containing phosphotransfer) domain-containing protein